MLCTIPASESLKDCKELRAGNCSKSYVNLILVLNTGQVVFTPHELYSPHMFLLMGIGGSALESDSSSIRTVCNKTGSMCTHNQWVHHKDFASPHYKEPDVFLNWSNVNKRQHCWPSSQSRYSKLSDGWRFWCLMSYFQPLVLKSSVICLLTRTFQRNGNLPACPSCL